MNIQTVLERLGYPESQVKVYLTALALGETSVVEIAARVKMPRSTVIDIINDMHKNGLIFYFIKRNRKIWVAQTPKKILDSWNERGAALQSILPALEALRPKNGIDESNLYHHIGFEEVKNVFDDIVQSKYHILAMASWDDLILFFGESYVKDISERRRAGNLKMRLITPKTAISEKMKQRDAEQLRQTRFLPEHILLKGVSHFIYGNKTALVALNRKEPAGLIVENAAVTHFLTIYFESLWRQSSDH